MRIGVSSAQGGRLANPAAVHAGAVAMEQVGYSSIWVRERPAGPGDCSLDAVAVLAATAMVTSHIGLGATVLVGHDTSPLTLARTIATLDVVSDGRVTVALETGCCGGAAMVLDLDQAWAQAQISPVQHPRPPVLLATASVTGLDAIARRADGWQPIGLGPHEVEPAWRKIGDRASEFGRDPAGLTLVVRADITLTEGPLGADRSSYCGSIEQVAEDIDAAFAIGASEVVLGFTCDLGFDQALDGYARIAESLRG